MSPPPVDLEISISTEYVAGSVFLHYALHSPASRASYTYYRLEGKTALRGHPEDYQARLLGTFEELGRGIGSDGSPFMQKEIKKEAEAVGRELYKELFSAALKVAYQEFRAKVRTLLIVSDEPWIPWELVKPHGHGFDDDFLCCRFELTRWLAGNAAPPEDLGIAGPGAARIVCIEAGSTLPEHPLARAPTECRHLVDFAKRHHGVESCQISDASYDEVERTLQVDGNAIIHFIGHNKFEAAEPNISRFLLADGRTFRPRDLLRGEIESRIRQDRPLVFFNCCQVAQQGYALSRLGGWASRWIIDCGCGAFIGPQWSVRDDSSYLFAKTFYASLERGETIAKAVQGARLKVRKEKPAGVGWLAYAVYAHPNARLRLGLGPTPVRIPVSCWRKGISPPGALLRAEYGIVPFHGRDDELANLFEWSGGEDPVRVRLYTSAGGMGKTRLALEVCRRLSEDGWQAGFLAPDPARSPADMWRDLRAHDKPTVVVVDDAETRREFLVPLLRRMYQAEKGKIRMLLLARAALDWWEQLKNEGEGVGDLLSGPATRWFTLMPLAMTAEDREASYGKAALAFSEHLGKPLPESTPEGLEAEYYERVLLLHMRALADIEGVPVKDEDGILDYILHREHRFWGRLAKERKLSKDLADGIGLAMGMITLSDGVDSEDHAVTAIGALKFFADQDRKVLVQVARLLHESYPGARWIEPILPDLLGEHLIQREMEKGHDELLDLVLGPRSEGEETVVDG